MTISVGSYDDLQPEPAQPIDRNPSIPCGMCGESYNWQDYWEKRVLNGDVDPSEKPWWCDSCWNDLREQAEIDRRKETHKQLTEFQ